MRFLTASIALATLALSGCPAGVDDCTLTVTNDTGFEWTALYVSDTSLSAWGANLLDVNLAASDSAVVIVAQNSGSTYDAQAIDVDGDTYSVYAFDFCASGEDLSLSIDLGDLDTAR